MAKGEGYSPLNVLGFNDDFQAYTFDPLANLTDSEIPLVLGGM